MTAADRERELQADALYEGYGRPLEAAHWGEYVAISSGGQTVLAPTALDAAEKALEAFGPGSFLFKVGEKAVWRWR